MAWRMFVDRRFSTVNGCVQVQAPWGVEIQAPGKTSIVTIFSTYPLSSTAPRSTRSGGFRGLRSANWEIKRPPARRLRSARRWRGLGEVFAQAQTREGAPTIARTGRIRGRHPKRVVARVVPTAGTGIIVQALAIDSRVNYRGAIRNERGIRRSGGPSPDRARSRYRAERVGATSGRERCGGARDTHPRSSATALDPTKRDPADGGIPPRATGASGASTSARTADADAVDRCLRGV